jgi:cytochrome P450
MYAFFTPQAVREVLVEHADAFSLHDLGGPLTAFLENGLFSLEGEQHTQQRRLLVPAFHHQQLERYHTIMVQQTQTMLERWEKEEQVDVLREMQQLTLRVAAATLFTAEIDEHRDALAKAFTTGLALGNLFWLWWNVPVLRWNLPITPYGRLSRAFATIERVLAGHIAQRRAQPAHADDPRDLLSALVAARDEQGNGFSDKQVRDHVITLLFAGHETTANWLTWALYLLARHPAVRENLVHELATVVAGRCPSTEDLVHLPYLEMVLTETLRLYPPAWVLLRQARRAVEIDGTVVAAGDLVWLSQWVMHRMPAYFPEPETFLPERFDPTTSRKHPSFAFFPFGAGSRLCLGRPFASLEAQLVLVLILQRFTPELRSSEPVAPRPVITLRPGRKMLMSLHPAQTC